MNQFSHSRSDRLDDGAIECGVEPQFISKDDLLACVEKNNNLILVEGSSTGVRAFYGQGAGASATASVMVDDILDLAVQKRNSVSENKERGCYN